MLPKSKARACNLYLLIRFVRRGMLKANTAANVLYKAKQMPTQVVPFSKAVLSESVVLKIYLVITGVAYIHKENKASQVKNWTIKSGNRCLMIFIMVINVCYLIISAIFCL